LAGAIVLVAALTSPIVTATANAAPVALSGWSSHVWSTQVVAPGVTVHSGVIGHEVPGEFWTVNVLVHTTTSADPDAPQAAIGPQAQARSQAAAVSAAGFQARVEEVDWPVYADTPRGPIGWRVRIGEYSSQAQATAEAALVTKAGFTTSVSWTGEDGGPIDGPWRIKVAVIDPHRFTGSVLASHGSTVSGRATPSAQASAAGALVATNGGFFVINTTDGIPGIPAGIGVYNGQLEREATNGRVDLIFGDDGHQPSIADLSTKITVSAGRSSTVVNGINRDPGIVRDCGEAGDEPTAAPLQDITCTNPNEIVLITPQLGGTPPSGPGVEAVVNAAGKVTALRARGGAVPANGQVLQGIGSGATWLQEHAKVGTVLRVHEQVTNDDTGRTLPIGPQTSILGGGPWLVRDGRIDVDAAKDGIAHPTDPSYIYGWGIQRNPRTIVGISRTGQLLLVTVDGRQPGYSEGFSLSEEASFMKSIGAVDAINLDGGGSTAMAIDGKLVTSPSDATGERPVGDTVLVLPGRR
jgi:hypothetical protein